jgi:hypothetical protein
VTVESEKKKSNRRASMDDLGQKIGKTVNEMEKEAERLVNYINAEVVPAVRQQSSVGLRKAAEKLAEFANYLDDSKRKS